MVVKRIESMSAVSFEDIKIKRIQDRIVNLIILKPCNVFLKVTMTFEELLALEQHVLIRSFPQAELSYN